MEDDYKKINLILFTVLLLCGVSSRAPVWAEDTNGPPGRSAQKLLTTLLYLSGYVPAKKEVIKEKK